MKVNAPDGKTYIVQASTNLVDWQTIGTTTLSADGSFEFEDPAAANHPRRFYRVRVK